LFQVKKTGKIEIGDMAWYDLGLNGLGSVISHKPTKESPKYEELMQLYKENFGYADGGITPIDANLEGDSVDIVESDFAKGGVVYDTTKPKLEKVTITRTGASSGSNRASVIGRYASNVSELQQIVSDYIGKSPQQEYDYIVFSINDNNRGNYYIELNKGKKNTVKNVNPETLNSLNFRRVIDAKTYLVKNYDWTDFFELGSQKPTSTLTGSKELDLTDTKVWLGDDSKLNEEIQKSAFSLGWEWRIGKIVQFTKTDALYFDSSKLITLMVGGRDAFDKSPNKELNPREILLATKPTITNTSAKTTLTKEELFNSRIWIGDNVELRDKVIAKLEEIGIPFDKYSGNADASESIDINIFGTDFVVYKESKEEFDKDIKRKEIFLSDLGISVSTPASNSRQLKELRNTKIWIGNNPELSEKIQKRAFELGWGWGGTEKTIKYLSADSIYFDGSNGMSYGDVGKDFFNNEKNKEVTESDILGTQIPNSNSDKEVTKIRLVYDTGTLKLLICNNGSELFDNLTLIEEEAQGGSLEVKITLSGIDKNNGFFETQGITQEVGKGGFEPRQIYSFEEFEKIIKGMFEAFNFDKFFYHPAFSSTVVNQGSNLAPYEASQVTLNWENLQGVAQTSNFYTGNGIGGFGKGFISFLKEIEKNSRGKDVEVTIKAYAKDNDGKDIERFTEFNIGENWFQPSKRTNEEIKSIVENDWIDGITFEKFFEDVIPLSGSQSTNLPTLSQNDLIDTKIWIGDDVELKDKVIDKLTQIGFPLDASVGNKDYTKNIYIYTYSRDFVVWDGSKTEDFEKSRFKEIFPIDLGIGLSTSQAPATQYKYIDLSQTKIWFGNDKEVSEQIQARAFELGWSWKDYTEPKSLNFVFSPALYFHSDKDISYGDDRELFDSNKDFREITFKDLFEKIEPTLTKQNSNISGSLGSVREITDFKEAVGVLEGIASQASQKYNTNKYDENLGLLKEVKEEYELALSFTPESSFMYERIELMKKITEIQKEITRITELKNGGAFYILSKVIERLDKGEDWKQLGNGEIMVNEVPPQEIDAVIYTEKFKNWFGDWEKALVTKEYDYVSKALTENGKPCVMYHGAKRIKYSYRQVSNGVLYLAENRSYAEWFSANESPFQKEGDYLTQCFVNIKNPIDLTPFGVEEVDLRDIIQYIDTLYPLAKIYDVLNPLIAKEIIDNNLIGANVRAWNIIRQYPELNTHIRENTNYDGFIYYENNPSDKIFNDQTGQLEDRITKATAVFKSSQVKLVDAMLFDGSLDDWRFEKGGKVN
jgi:hypothetical protein